MYVKHHSRKVLLLLLLLVSGCKGINNPSSSLGISEVEHFLSVEISSVNAYVEPLSGEKELEIKKVWYQQKRKTAELPPDEEIQKLVTIKTYYGQYDFLYAIHIRGLVGSFFVVTVEQIAGYKFIYTDSIRNHTYNENTEEIIYLHEAYSQGLLTKGNIAFIYEVHKAANPFLYENGAEDLYEVDFFAEEPGLT